MTLTVRLDAQEEKWLQEIVEALKADSQSTVIRKMIEDKWNALQAERTFVERRGGHPVHLLGGQGDDSQRANRKAELASHYADRAAARKRSADATSTD
jgi:hypothetical protein